MDTILYETLFGSHLYGTNTPTSDLDIKRVVLPSLDHVLLGKPLVNKVRKTNKAKNVRNTVDDVDQEDIPLQVFIRDFVEGQTYAIELAFGIGSPVTRSFNSEFYALVKELRTEFLTSNIKAMMGYVFNQANIYSFKGERLNCAREFRELLLKMFTDTDAGDDQLHDNLPDPGMTAYNETLNGYRGLAEIAGSRDYPTPDALVESVKSPESVQAHEEFYGQVLGNDVIAKQIASLAEFGALEAKYPKYFRVSEYDIGGGRMRPCFVVLEKTFPWTNTLGHSLKVADTLIGKYGSRADQASESNVDWKALMHAVRIIDEGIELLTTKSLTLPRPPEQTARLLQIKRGELPLEPLKDELVEKLDLLKGIADTCGLPSSSDKQLTERVEEFSIRWLRTFYGLK